MNFAGVRRKAVRLSTAELVEEGYLDPERKFPLVVRPGVEGLEAARWAEANRPWVEARLLRHGALLWRGWRVESEADFARFAEAVGGPLLPYAERSSPRTALSRPGLYTSTDHPPELPILLHCEQSYTLRWPMKLFFGCLAAATRGGATPVADTRRVLRRLEGGVAEEFRRRGVMYVRHYGGGLGLGWEEAFQAAGRDEVERQCRERGIEWEWLGGGRLRTRQVRPAVRRHPATGEEVWFNHALFFHPRGLGEEARAAVAEAVGEGRGPSVTYYGDGGEIPEWVLGEVEGAYAAEAVRWGWEEGDVLVVDNMLAAHGREAYEGGRRVVVAMAQPHDGR